MILSVEKKFFLQQQLITQALKKYIQLPLIN